MPEATDTSPAAISIRGLRHSYGRQSIGKRGTSAAEVLKGISLDVPEGQTLGLVGESGCGKSTLVKSILRLVQPTAGEVMLRTKANDSNEINVLTASPRELKLARQRLQVVFQDPYGSLNPRMSVHQTVSEPLQEHFGLSKEACRARVGELLELVGLDPTVSDRYPHEFSGGQRQRIGIARALAFEPRVLILDEPVSALDVSVQAQILNLIVDLQERLGLTYLFVSHDLAVIEHVADTVAVMYLGEIVEFGATEQLFRNPSHPYTQALLSASPVADVDLERKRTRIILRGDTSSGGSTSGCQFANRCQTSAGRSECTESHPELRNIGSGHLAACHFAGV